MSTSIVPILAYQLSLINALNISGARNRKKQFPVYTMIDEQIATLLPSSYSISTFVLQMSNMY